MSPNRESPFCEMIAAAQRLIEAQEREHKLRTRSAKRRKADWLEQCQAARHAVEQLGEQYLTAIRNYRESVSSYIPYRVAGHQYRR
jgi:hypothetical protein